MPCSGTTTPFSLLHATRHAPQYIKDHLGEGIRWPCTATNESEQTPQSGGVQQSALLDSRQWRSVSRARAWEAVMHAVTLDARERPLLIPASPAGHVHVRPRR